MTRPNYQVLIDWNGDDGFSDSDEDVSSDVVELNLDRLRDPITDYMNGTVLDLTLKNSDHKYSPPKGTISGLQPGRKVWVRLWYPFDDFDGSASTNLDNHVPVLDSEWSWSTPAGDIELNGSGAARVPATTNPNTAYFEFSDTDISIFSRLTRGSTGTGNCGLLLRYVNDSNYVYLKANGTDLVLNKRIAGSNTTVKSVTHTWAVSTTKDLYIEVHGNQFRAFIDNVLLIDEELDDAAINAGTKHGLFGENPGTFDWTWENFGGFRSLFFGRIDTIKPRPAPGAEYCYIRAVDDFEVARATTLFMASNAAYPQSTNDILNDVLDFMDITSGARILDDGEQLVPNDGEGFSGPSWNIPALDAIQKLQDEEDGFIYIDGHGFWRLEDFQHRIDINHRTAKSIYKDTDDGNNPYFANLAWEDGAEYVENVIDMQIQPGTDGATANFFSMKEVPFFAANESRDFLVEATFDAIDEEITPVNNTDYEANTNSDGSGTDISNDLTVSLPDATRFNGKGALIRVVWGSTPGFLTKLDMRAAVVITFDDPVNIQQEDSTSITANGRKTGSLNARFIREVALAEAAVSQRLARRKDPKTRLSLTMNGGTKETLHAMIQRNIADVVNVVYSDMGIDDDFAIDSESWRIQEGGRVFSQEIVIRELSPIFSTGWRSPGTMADDATVGTIAWGSVDNAKASDDSDASFSATNAQSHYLKATNFGFALPSTATVLGIQVAIEHSGSNTVNEVDVLIIKGGTIGSEDRSQNRIVPGSDTYKLYGTSQDLWGETWLYSDINASTMGVAFSIQAIGFGAAGVDHIRMRVLYST